MSSKSKKNKTQKNRPAADGYTSFREGDQTFVIPHTNEPGSAHLKTLRESAGLTLAAAAELVGVNLRTWQHWESPAYADTPIKEDVFDALWEIIHHKIESLDLMATHIDAMDEDAEATGYAPPAIAVTRYRDQEQLDRAHPGYPGGIGAHSALVVAMIDTFGDRITVQWAPDTF